MGASVEQGGGAHGELLSVQIEEAPPYVAGIWTGGGEGAGEAARIAGSDLLSRRGETLVLDLGGLSPVSEEVAAALAVSVGEAQRLGRHVCLVRCPDHLYRRLQEAGVCGSLSHAPSLAAATQGLLGERTEMLELHLRSMPELLHRLRNVVSVVARQAGFCESTEHLLRAAVNEAAANAMVHGSPEGPRNHVRVSFHLDRQVLTVDVADQGPGFDPTGVPVPRPDEFQERGYGLHMIRQSMDRVEFFRDSQGMLVRMTKFVEPSGRWAQ